jgi:hypothetical protein
MSALPEETSGDSQVVKKSNFAVEMPELNLAGLIFLFFCSLEHRQSPEEPLETWINPS